MAAIFDVPRSESPTLTNMFKAARAQDHEIAALKAELEAKDAIIAELVEALKFVQPLFHHALEVCDGEGVGPAQVETDHAEMLIEALISKAEA